METTHNKNDSLNKESATIELKDTLLKKLEIKLSREKKLGQGSVLYNKELADVLSEETINIVKSVDNGRNEYINEIINDIKRIEENFIVEERYTIDDIKNCNENIEKCNKDLTCINIMENAIKLSEIPRNETSKEINRWKKSLEDANKYNEKIIRLLSIIFSDKI